MILFELFADKDKYLNTIKEEWFMARDTFPDFFADISPDTKQHNKLYLNSATDDFQKQIQSFPRLPIGRKKWKQKTLRLLSDVLYNETIIGLHHTMKPPVIDDFVEEIFEFMRQVRSFAPELTFTDIGQAVRNYIVYAMFKKIHDETSGFNLAAFGYSMLYPFTDNYIDNTKCTPKEKQAYNRIIRDKLQGLPVHPENEYQAKTCKLLQTIEAEYPKEKKTGANQLLLMMLEAQEYSLRQQSKELPLSMEQRMDISVYKGGISVLIDRFFVNKEIQEKDLIFYLGFGFFLQLADDLQDIKEDSEQGHSTLFTMDLNNVHKEKVVNKLLHFLHQIMDDYEADNDSFKNFILSASYLLVFSSVAGSREFFSTEYLDRIENYLPIPSPALENYLHSQIETMDPKLQKKYLKILDVLVK